MIDPNILPRVELRLNILRSLGTELRNDDTGLYHWKNGETFPSVTTILSGTLAKWGLQVWFGRIVAEYVQGKASELTDLIAARERGEIKGSELLRAVQELAGYLSDVDTMKRVPEAVRDAAGDRGSIVHRLAERLLAGESVDFDALSPEIRPYMEGVANYLADYPPDPVGLECAVFSREHGYAGTFDWIDRTPEGLVIRDWKTGGASYPDHALQLAAYRNAEFVGLEDGTEFPMPEVVGGTIVLVGPKQGKKLYNVEPWPCGEREFGIFCGLRRTFDWLAEARRVEFRRERRTRGNRTA